MIVAVICLIAAATLTTIAARLALLIIVTRRRANRERSPVPHRVKRAIGVPFGVAALAVPLFARAAAAAWLDGGSLVSSDSMIGGVIAHGPPGDLAVIVVAGLACWMLWIRAVELEERYRP